jgi:hypothetical protein
MYQVPSTMYQVQCKKYEAEIPACGRQVRYGIENIEGRISIFE